LQILVLNATPLIYLTKIGFAWLFEKLPFEFWTVSNVEKEVVEVGIQLKALDAVVIKDLIASGKIKIINPSNRPLLSMLTSIHGLHVGEAAVLALAKERGCIAILDDEKARRVARTLGIKYEGTPFLFALAVTTEKITKDQALSAINEMIRAGWRCGAQEYSEIVKMLERI